MKKLSLICLIFSLVVYYTQGFSYSQQSGKLNTPTKTGQSDNAALEEEYLKYEGPNVGSMTNMFSASLRMITVLLVLLALFLFVTFVLKRFQQKRSIQSKGPISVLFQLPVGSKESICLVDVMGEILVLGVTSSQISLLFKVEDTDALKSFQESQGRELRPDPTSGHQFQNYLKSERENIKVASELRSSELRSTVLESLRTLRDKLRKV